MCIKNRGVAVLYRLLAFIVGSIALIYDFGLFNGEFKRANLLYFTIISNLFCVIFFGCLVVKTVADIRNEGIYGSTTFLTHIRRNTYFHFTYDVCVSFYFDTLCY